MKIKVKHNIICIVIEVIKMLDNKLGITNDREVYTKGIDSSYKYEEYSTYTMSELDN